MTAVATPALTPRAAARPARQGVMAMLPFVAGYAPFALALGAAVAAHGDALAGWAGSWLLYGGSAHLATLHTLETSGLVLAIIAGAVVNTRLLVYSTSLARRWHGQPLWFRLVAAPMVIDPTWALADARGDGDTPEAQRSFFLAIGLTLGVGWSALIGLGALIGDRIDATHLVVAVPLCLASMVGPRLVDPDTRVVCAVAAVVALLARHVPTGGSMLLAIAAGCIAGQVGDRGAR